jgi:hypothetical protein
VVESGLRNLGVRQEKGVQFSKDKGTLDETVAALGRAGFTPGAVMDLFSADLFRQQYESALPRDPAPQNRPKLWRNSTPPWASGTWHSPVADGHTLLRTYRERVRGHRSVGALPERNVEHLRGMAERLAHLGGGKWQDTLTVAQAFSNVAFTIRDKEWMGAPNAPTTHGTNLRTPRNLSCRCRLSTAPPVMMPQPMPVATLTNSTCSSSR